MADLEKKIVLPIEADPKKADAQVDKFKKDAAKEGVLIPVNIDIEDITKALHAIQGMVGKMEKAFDKDIKFSGLQNGLDDISKKIQSVVKTINKGTPDEIQVIKVDVNELDVIIKGLKSINGHVKSLNESKIDLNSFERLYSIFEKMETLLNSIVKGMNFDNIRPSTQIQDEITKTTEKLDKLAKSEKKIKDLENYFSKRTAIGIGKDILEWQDSEGVKESSLDNLIKKMKEYISLGGDLSNFKISVFDVEKQKKELYSFVDVLEILQDEGKIDLINSSQVSNDIVEVRELRQELSELNKELNDAQIRENRDLNVSLDTKSVEDFSKAIASAVEKIGELHFDIPEGFTLEGLSPENLDKIVNKLDEIVLSIKNIGKALTNGVDFSKVTDSLQEESEPIGLRIKPNIDAVAFFNEIQEELNKAGFGFVEVKVEPLVDSTEAFVNSIEDQLNLFGDAVVKIKVKPSEIVQDDEENNLQNIEQKVRDIIDAVNDKIDAFKNEENQVKESSQKEVESLSKIEDKVKEISDNNNLQLKLDSTEIYNEIDNIVETINKSIPDTKEIEIKFKQYKDTDILTDFEGKAIKAFRGVQETIGGMISDKQNGITFYSDRYDVAESYANRLHDGKEVAGKVYESNLAMKNPLEIDAKGSTWKSIKYLGDESDEASKNIIELNSKIQDLRGELGKLYNFDNLESGFTLDEFGTISGIIEKDEKKIPAIFDTIDDYEKAIGKFNPMSMLDKNRIQAQKLLEQLQDVSEAYYDISDAKDNMYGTHTTDEWADIARANGYDGIIIKNLYDAVGDTFKGEDSLSTIFAVFDSEQLKNTQVVKDSIEEIANASNKIDSHNIEDLDQTIKELLAKEDNTINIKVDPQVDATDFANKVTEQLQGISAEINVEPKEIINSLDQASTDTDIGTTGMTSEAEQAEILRQKIIDITTAVDTKTRAFQEEEQVVVGTVQREISSLEALDGQIWSIINELKRLDDIKIQINIDSSHIDDSFVVLLDNIKTKADGLPIDTLSNLATALQGLKVTSKTAENLELVAVALSEFKDSLSGITPEGNEFLKLIGDITSRTDQLKDLAEVLKSTTKKIQEAGNATKNSSDDSSNNDASSESKINEEIAASIRKKKEELASYELQVEELRYEIEKLQKAESNESNEKFGFDRGYSNKQAEWLRDKLVSKMFTGDNHWRMVGDVNNLNDSALSNYQRYQEELQKIGYQLGEIRQIGHDQLEADIIPIPDKAITNAEECRRLLSEITSMPNDKVIELNAQVTELENRISSVNAEIKELESASSSQKDTSKNDKKKNKNYDAKKNQAAIEETKASMEKLRHLSDSDIFSDAFEEASTKIKEVNTNLNAGTISLTEYKKKVKEIQTELQKQAGVIKFVDPGDLENARAVIGAYAREVSEYQAKLTSDLPTSNKKQQNITYQWIEKETGMVRTLTLTYDKLTGAIYETSKAHTKAEKSGFKFSEMLKQGWMNVIRYIASFVSFYEVWNVIKQGFATIKELDTALTEMRKVSDESVQSLKNFQKVSFDLADTVGTTAKQIQNSTADFMRLGESLKEATESAKVANILLNVSEFGDIDSATESLIAMSAAYSELEKQDIVDKLNEVGKILAQTYSNVWRYKNLSR